MIESAVTTIQDLEDSVATVAMRGKNTRLSQLAGAHARHAASELREGRQAALTRRLNPDRRYLTPSGSELVLPGRSLMLVRNVGHHMLSDAVTLDGAPIPETFIDAAVTSLIALHDLRGTSARHNSRTGSVYIVKPKMHGPEEAAFAGELFAEVETLLGLPREHAQDRHHGRGAAHQREPRRVHSGGTRSRGVHQHGISRPHGR